jgi:hypothetical protein
MIMGRPGTHIITNVMIAKRASVDNAIVLAVVIDL